MYFYATAQRGSNFGYFYLYVRIKAFPKYLKFETSQ